MKLTIKKLKNLIREELEKMNEMGSYMGMTKEEIEAEIASIERKLATEFDPRTRHELESYRDDLLLDLADAM